MLTVVLLYNFKWLRKIFLIIFAGESVKLPRLHHTKVTISLTGPGSELKPIFRAAQNRKLRGHAELCSTPQPSPIRIPLSPHLVLRVHGGSRRQKLLHHRRMTFDRSAMQRGVSILRRAAALRQATPLSSARMRAPPPAPATPYIFTAPSEGRNRGTAHERSLPAQVRRQSVLISASNTLHTSGQAFRPHTPESSHCKPITLHSRTSSSPGALDPWLQLQSTRQSSLQSVSSPNEAQVRSAVRTQFVMFTSAPHATSCRTCQGESE
jgi:hypothetical protein